MVSFTRRKVILCVAFVRQIPLDLAVLAGMCAMLATAAPGCTSVKRTPTDATGLPGSRADGGPSAGGKIAGSANGDAGFKPSSNTFAADSGSRVDGGSGAAASPVGKRRACAIEVVTACMRQELCQGEVELLPCADSIAMCPVGVFAAGSVRTVADLLTCADAWKQLSCEDEERHLLPECDLPGTREPGEPCLAGAQCKYRCSVRAAHPDFPECHPCLAMAAPGGHCDTMTACPGGQRCTSSTSGVCADVRVLQRGEPCVNEACAAPLVCRIDPANAAPPGVDSTLYCLPAPQAGEDCGWRSLPRKASDPFANAFCAQDTFCNAALKCQAWPKAGEPCALDHKGQQRCQFPLYCATGADAGSGVCTPRPQPGEACGRGAMAAECDFGLDCIHGTCWDTRVDGERCDEPNTRCAAGTECQRGTCTATQPPPGAGRCG
jgi:hypothetical protein